MMKVIPKTRRVY